MLLIKNIAKLVKVFNKQHFFFVTKIAAKVIKAQQREIVILKVQTAN